MKSLIFICDKFYFVARHFNVTVEFSWWQQLSVFAPAEKVRPLPSSKRIPPLLNTSLGESKNLGHRSPRD